MTEAQRLAQRVEVVVKPHNNYGGAPAGTRLVMTRAEFESASRCLEEVSGPPEPGPRTATVSIPAHAAKTLGFPMGRRQEGPLVYEVTRLPPDGKAPLPSREDLQRQAQGGGAAVVQIKVMDRPEVKAAIARVKEEVESIASAFGWEEEDGAPGAWMKRSIPQIRAALTDTEKLRADLAKAQHEVEEVKRDAASYLSAALTKAQDGANAELEKRDQEIAKLRAELEAAKAAPAPAPEQVAEKPKAKAKE